jgi:ribosomal 50S subunit-recycling heat shock protein
MRIDKFLNAVNLTKRRAVAQDMLVHGVVRINDVVAKPSKQVKVGDLIALHYLEYVKTYKVLDLPTTKSTPKSEQMNYVKEVA